MRKIASTSSNSTQQTMHLTYGTRKQNSDTSRCNMMNHKSILKKKFITYSGVTIAMLNKVDACRIGLPHQTRNLERATSCERRTPCM